MELKIKSRRGKELKLFVLTDWGLGLIIIQVSTLLQTNKENKLKNNVYLIKPVQFYVI